MYYPINQYKIEENAPCAYCKKNPPSSNSEYILHEWAGESFIGSMQLSHYFKYEIYLCNVCTIKYKKLWLFFILSFFLFILTIISMIVFYFFYSLDKFIYYSPWYIIIIILTFLEISLYAFVLYMDFYIRTRKWLAKYTNYYEISNSLVYIIFIIVVLILITFFIVMHNLSIKNII